MRLASLALSLGATAIGFAHSANAAKSYEPTIFNGEEVPPLLELTPANYDQELTSTKFTVVKYFSPSCPHCQHFAPTYQTLYEYYYTSEIPSSFGASTAGKSGSEFENYYDIKFASLNCMAYGDLCSKQDVTHYPTTMIFKNGERADVIRGDKDIDVVAEIIETALDKDKPGSRTKKLSLASLPSPGKDSSPDFDPNKPKKTTLSNPVVNSFNKPSKIMTPNEGGNSVQLTAESFQKFVTMTRDSWFVKFYAPWCHHCQAIASNWQQLAKEMKGKLNIGEVNCDAESRLCKDVGVRGYPTILFFRGGERVEYDGLRGLGDFVHYAERALDVVGGVPTVDATSFEALEKKEDVIFTYFFDHATATEDFMALERWPLSLIGHAKLVKTSDPALFERFKITTWPRLIVSREGRPTYYTPLAPADMRDTHQVLSWMKSVWLPIVPEVSASNAREIMDGKIVVLGILNREDQESFAGAVREMKSAANEWMDKQIQLFQMERQDLRDAKQLRIEEAKDRGDQRAERAASSIRISMDMSDRKEVAFAWVDGQFWQRWIRTTYGIDIKDGDRVIINDEDRRQYWDETITGNFIVPSRTSILETISKVTSSPPAIKAKLTVSSIEKFFLNIRMTFYEHPWLSMGCIIGVAMGFWTTFRGRLRRSGFKIEENLPIKEFGGGLLGNSGNGKVD